MNIRAYGCDEKCLILHWPALCLDIVRQGCLSLSTAMSMKACSQHDLSSTQYMETLRRVRDISFLKFHHKLLQDTNALEQLLLMSLRIQPST